MMDGHLEGLAGEGERRAARRSRAFALLAGALGYPEGLLLEDIREGRLAEALAATLGELVVPALDVDALRDGLERDDLAVEYTRLFDVGTSGPPCPLHEGLWAKDRMKTMEEVLRFYHHFGLSLDPERHELPDHLVAELEFLHYLTFREAEALQAGLDAGAYQRARRDFVARHPGRFVPQVRGVMEANGPPRFFSELFRSLNALLVETRGD